MRTVKLKIGIDGRNLQGKITGIGRYVRELCINLNKLLPEATFYIYTNRPIQMPVVSENWILRKEENYLAYYIKPVFWLKYFANRLIFKDELDVFWGTATFIPKLPKGVKSVVTVHDINYVVAPETLNITKRIANQIYYERDIKSADVVLTNSKATADRLFNIHGIETNGIVRPGVSEIFKPQNENEIMDFLNYYKLKRPFLLGVATWEPRKNLDLLVRAFIEMKFSGLLTEHKLVLVGKRGWKDKKIKKLISNCEFSSEIISLGYIPYEHLPKLYAACDVFVFPSKYEGFGIPIIEALACGAKVVATNIPELREAGGDYAIYIEPTIEEIKLGILRALNTHNNNGKKRLQIPRWEESARVLAEALTR